MQEGLLFLTGVSGQAVATRDRNCLHAETGERPVAQGACVSDVGGELDIGHRRQSADETQFVVGGASDDTRARAPNVGDEPDAAT